MVLPKVALWAVLFASLEGVLSPPLAAQASRPYHAEAVRYQSRDIALAAELMLPRRDGHFPAAVIIQGSGASDRRNAWARAVSELLVHRGVAVLLTDKRGSGESGGDWRTASFDDLALDALSGVAYLRGRPEIDRERVGLVGLSQGGWIAPLVAARFAQVAFVINIAGAAVSFAEQSFVEMANTARQAGLSEEQVGEVLELNRAVARYLTTGDWEHYSSLRQRALQGPWKNIAAGFPASPDQPIWSFLRSVATFDPMPYWLQVSQPVLVAYGEDDERDNVPVAESVRRLQFGFQAVGKRNYHIMVVPGVGHSLIDHQRHELAPAFVDALDRWTREHVTGRDRPARRP